jgi:hypothetical protein
MALHGGAPVDLFRCQVLLVRSDEPAMAEGVGNTTDAIAIKLIGHRACELGTGGNCPRQTTSTSSP